MVSEDGGWKQFAEKSEVVICTNELGKALSFFQSASNFIFERFLEEITSNNSSEISAEIEGDLARFVEGMRLDVQASSSFMYEEEIISQSFSHLTLEKYLSSTPIEQSEGEIVVETSVKAIIIVDCQFNFIVRDSIDGDYIKIGELTTSKNFELDFDLLLSMKFGNDDKIELISVEVVGSSDRVDFGSVEPDYRRNYEDNEYDRDSND